jgi:muramidase (phage lysozyme)
LIVATIIDALVVTFGLDASKFKQGSAQVQKTLKDTSSEATRAAKEMEARGKQAAQFFASIKTEALSVLAIFTAGKGLKAFISDTLASSAQLQNLAGNLQMSATNVQAWQKTFERAGASAADATSLFTSAATEIGKLKTGQGMGEALKGLAMSGGNINEALKGPREMVLEESRVLARLNAINPALARARAQQMGLSDAQFAVLKAGPEALETQVAAQQKLLGLNDDQIMKLAEVNAKWADLKTQFQGIANAVLIDVLPVITKLIALMSRHPEIAAAAVAFTSLAAALKLVGSALSIIGGGAGKGALGVLGKLGVAGAAAMTGLEVAKAAGLPDVDAKKGQEDVKKGDWLAASAHMSAGDFLGTVWNKLTNSKASDIVGKINSPSGSGSSVLGVTGSGAPYGFNTGNGAPAASAQTVASTVASVKQVVKEAGKGIAESAFGALISKGEGDYNSVNRGARGGYKAGTENLAGMTVAEVMAAQKSGKFNAAGRYQLIGSTLSDAVKAMGLKGDEKFDKGTQDKIFEQYLVNNKRKAIGDFINGRSSNIGAAIKAASMEWASVADPDTGLSHYAGVGNNKASISVAQMTQALQNARMSVSGRGAGSSTSEVNIQQVTIQTQATDANGIARDAQVAFSKHPMIVPQANRGLS